MPQERGRMMTVWQRWLRQPQRVWLRTVIFQVHLWSGIGAGLYILAISLTGSLLVYRNELYRAATPAPTASTASGPQSASPPVPRGIRAMTMLLDFHDNLFAGSAGRKVNAVGALLLLLLVKTGAVIWWPGVDAWRGALTVRRHVGWKRLIWELHRATGFWSFGFLLLFGVTGLYLGMPEPFHELGDYLQPLTPENAGERLVDRITYWLAYLHFGRLGGRGIPGCGRGLCDSTTKFIWAVFGLTPAVMFVTGAVMWWNRVLRRVSNS
jgi:uncharacterized iron-regulated membrane protein